MFYVFNLVKVEPRKPYLLTRRPEQGSAAAGILSARNVRSEVPSLLHARIGAEPVINYRSRLLQLLDFRCFGAQGFGEVVNCGQKRAKHRVEVLSLGLRVFAILVWTVHPEDLRGHDAQNRAGRIAFRTSGCCSPVPVKLRKRLHTEQFVVILRLCVLWGFGHRFHCSAKIAWF